MLNIDNSFLGFGHEDITSSGSETGAGVATVNSVESMTQEEIKGELSQIAHDEIFDPGKVDSERKHKLLSRKEALE